MAQPSFEHLKMMKVNRSIDCKILKYMKVPSHEYRVVPTIYTSNSFYEKTFEVSISNYSLCSCLDYKFMKFKANQKHKWLICKHLNFLMQKHCACTKDDVFVYCPRLTKSSLF